MQSLTFTKTSIIASFWDESSEKWQDRDISESELPITWYFPYEVFVDEGVTIRDILDQLQKYSSILNFVFISYLMGISIESLFESLSSKKSINPTVNIDMICLLWIAETSEIIGESTVNMYPTLMALEMSEEEDDEEGEETDDKFHSIRELSISQLLDTQFMIDDIFELYDNNNPNDIIFSGVTNWSVYDFIRSIFKELILYSFSNGIFKRSDTLIIHPLSSTELFEHMEDLDKYFNN